MNFINKVEQKAVSASLLVSPIDWELPKLLDNIQKNKELYLKYKKSTRSKILHTWDNGIIDLIECGQRVLLLNHDLQHIEYYVQYEFGKFRGLKIITQIALWAYKDYPLPSIEGLSAIKWAFFKYLMPKADAIVADTLQTDHGKSFWLRRIGDAWELNYHVYMVLRDKNNIIKIANRSDLHKVEPYVWGTKRHHEYRRAFISKKDIFSDAISVDQFCK
jgi:hypothetical protein